MINFKYILLFLFIAFQINVLAKSSNFEKENFNTFLKSFTTDSMFQISRISQDFESCIYLFGTDIKTNSKIDTICEKFKVQNWRHLKLIEPENFYTIYNSFEKKKIDSDTKVFAFEEAEASGSSYYYFKRVKGKWYLVKIEIMDVI